MDSYYRFGFISQIFKQLEEKRPYYGKIVIQKLLYFIQEATGVDLGYSFSFYHYGPFSEELARDIQIMEFNQLIITSSDPKDRGYSIHLNEKEAEELIRECSSLISDNQDKIDKVLEDFGRYKPSHLELEATIHFIHKDLRLQGKESDIRQKVINLTKKMKPKFNQSVISDGYDRLEELKYIS